MRGYGGMRDEDAAASATASRRAMEDEVGMTTAAAVGKVCVVVVGAGVATATVAVSDAEELGRFVGYVVGNAVKVAAVELFMA